jgi:hypothetical protein
MKIEFDWYGLAMLVRGINKGFAELFHWCMQHGDKKKNWKRIEKELGLKQYKSK